MGFLDDTFQCIFIHLHVLSYSRLGNRDSRRFREERADFREIEKPFGVRLGAAHTSSQLRQPGAYQYHRQEALRGSVQSRDERSQFIFLDVLELIDE